VIEQISMLLLNDIPTRFSSAAIVEQVLNKTGLPMR